MNQSSTSGLHVAAKEFRLRDERVVSEQNVVIAGETKLGSLVLSFIYD